MLFLHTRLVTLDQLGPVVRGQIGIEREALLVLVAFEDFLEVIVADAEHNVGIHRDEAAIAVIGEAAVAGGFRQRLDRHVVEAEVEHRIHHARHRGARAGAHRDEQRVCGVAEFAAGDARDVIERVFHLRLNLLRVALLVGVKVSADLGRDREAGRHRQAEVRHLGEVRALAAEQILHVGLALGRAVAKGVDPLGHVRSFLFFCCAKRLKRASGCCLGRFSPSIQLASPVPNEKSRAG